MKLKLFVFTFIAILLVSFNTYADIPETLPATLVTTLEKSQTNTENRAYAGLVWTLQEKMSLIPDLTIGFRSLRVKSSDSISGGEVSARIKFKDGISFDSTRLSYVGGERDLLGNIGIGYSEAKSSFLGIVAVQGAYTRLGTDYQFNGNKFAPYVEVLTVDKPNKVKKIPASTSYVCDVDPYLSLSGNVCYY